MKTNVTQPDTRTPEQRRLDEAVAEGNWEGFETEELLTEEEAQDWLSQKRLATVAEKSLSFQPFRWRNGVFRILRCEYQEGEAIVEVAPHDDEFINEIKRRLTHDRFHFLGFYQGFGFACFPEDYQQYSA